MERVLRWRQQLGERVDGSSLALLRIAFGGLMLAAVVRCFARGFIDELYVKPAFHFTYMGFGWVRPWPQPFLNAHFALLGVAALGVAVGLFYRYAIVLFTLLFAYVELLDVTTYLNHYYAIALVGLLLCVLPAANVLSLDAVRARRRGAPLPRSIPRAALTLLRVQLGIVYFFAGIAKLQPDWLLRAQPLTIWLAARSDAALIGPLLTLPHAPLVMSWAGALFDLSVPFLLRVPRTRAAAYAAVIAFHALTSQLFQIGMFPWVMIGLTPIFFAPDWPHTLLRRLRGKPETHAAEPEPGRPLGRATFAAFSLWITLQLALPLRHHLYAGEVLTSEQGFRWSWHVMIVERSGSATFRVVDARGHTQQVRPTRDLTPMQARMMATQPDLILAYAHHLRDTFAAEGQRVRVYADVFVSTNGRPSQRLVAPDVDLAIQKDTLLGYSWLLKQPSNNWF